MAFQVRFAVVKKKHFETAESPRNIHILNQRKKRKKCFQRETVVIT